MAVEDDVLRRNPFEFKLATVVVNDSVTREAITREQERTFLNFDHQLQRTRDMRYVIETPKTEKGVS